MPPAWIVPALDELEDRHTGLGLGLELPPFEQLAFKRGEEALTHGVIVGFPDRSYGWPHTGFLAPQAEGDGRVLRSLI